MGRNRSESGTWPRVAFLASAGAAGVHLAAVRPHLDEYAPAGAFMLVAGVAQAVWCLWVARGASRVVLEAGIAGNAAIVALWIATRTAGIPAGPMAGQAEHVHGADLVATALEVLVIVAAIAMASGQLARPEPVLARLALAGALATVFAPGDDPLRDGAVAAATLVLILAVRAYASAVASIVTRPDRRSHVQVTFARRPAAGIRAAAGAGLGARG